MAAHQEVARAASSSVNIGSISFFTAAVVFLVITWLVVGLRFYVRGFMLRSIGLDDWLMAATLASHTLENAMAITIARMELEPGLGVLRVSKFILLNEIFYSVTMILLKLSLAVFFLRIVIKNWQRWTIYVSTGFYTAFATAWVFVVIFQCGNPKDFSFFRTGSECIPWVSVEPVAYIHGVLNALTDWVFAILPVFVLQLSQLPKRAKFPVFVLIGVAVLGSVSSCVRIAFIGGLRPGSFADADDISTWSIIEPGIGIAAASLATLRPIFRSCFDVTRTAFSTHGASTRRFDSPLQHKGRPVQVMEKHVSHASSGSMHASRTHTSIVGNARDVEEWEISDMDSTIPPNTYQGPGSRSRWSANTDWVRL